MRKLKMAVIPVGKVDAAEVEQTVSRLAKVVREPIELCDALPVPQGVEDTVRRQFRAAVLLTRLRSRVPQLGPGRLIGAEAGVDAKPAERADLYVFVSDVDIFTAQTDGVFAALSSKEGHAVISVRRLREAFYRRKADHPKQRTRLVKELLRIAGRLRKIQECSNPSCALAPSRSLADIDTKDESYCATCTEWLFAGTIHI